MSTIEIDDWKPLIKGALRGFFSVTLPSGLILRQCAVFEKDGRRFVNGPSQSFTNGGKTTYKPLVEFVDKPTRDKFNTAVLAALDEHLGASR